MNFLWLFHLHYRNFELNFYHKRIEIATSLNFYSNELEKKGHADYEFLIIIFFHLILFFILLS